MTKEDVGRRLGRGPDAQSRSYYKNGRRREAGVPGRACLWDCENLVLIRRRQGPEGPRAAGSRRLLEFGRHRVCGQEGADGPS